VKEGEGTRRRGTPRLGPSGSTEANTPWLRSAPSGARSPPSENPYIDRGSPTPDPPSGVATPRPA
jgi:hypothetical protein